jgi:uncharacterized membrane protein
LVDEHSYAYCDALDASLLFLLFRRRMMGAFFLASAGFLLFVVALLVTLMVNIPHRQPDKAVAVTNLPSDWPAIRDRWEFYHSLRTFASLAGLACAFASALFRSK